MCSAVVTVGDARLPRRFWEKVRVDADPGCWLWIAGCNRAGYGHFRVGPSDQRMAHRHAFETLVGPIPAGLKVLHRCDTPPCVNPDHLFPGTQLDNVRDMHRKGRASSRAGEANGRARLTAALVSEIRERYAGGRATQCELAAEYGVFQSTIGRALSGETWGGQ